MGMAAGQARLLSITSRMSDNELRAQIINNQKMRLATQSSQVSEAYTTALNDAQMMFTNYDADNNATYQQLTFNALTAYNPYNNQYAISNASGQVMVSEKDAINYKAANGDLNKFLGYYGLENTTTYFDNLDKYANADGTIPYSTGTVDDDGNAILENSGYTKEMLQAAYEGYDGHLGYQTIVASEQYYNYSSAITNFNEAYTNWSATIAESMQNYFSDTLQGNGKNLETIQEDIDNAEDVNDMKSVLTDLSAFVNEAGKLSLGTSDTQKYFSDLQESINGALTGETEYSKDEINLSYTEDTEAGKSVLSFGYKDENDDEEEPQYSFVIEKQSTWITDDIASGTGHWGDPATYTVSAYDVDTETMKVLDASEYTMNRNPDGTITLIYNDTEIAGLPNYLDGTGSDDYTITETAPLDLEYMKETANEVIKSLNSAIYNVWNPGLDIFANNENNQIEYNNYLNAAKELEKVIFGNNSLDKEEYPNLVDVSWILTHMNQTQLDNFQPILDVITLDNIMNTYGEPQYAWIDTSNASESYNENGDAKAQWYTNLFNRMQSGGYQVLQDGLASSSEWMQFAFESGLVTLEQVDSEYNWNTLMYSSCSDITEQTNDTAITIAEAEYNAAMNKIENKDKMYDLELKNIDTEHNSLQTEYDSIKTAIDKNIERTFKIYS